MLAYLYFQNPDHDYHGEGGLTPFGSDPTDFSPLVPGEQVREVSFWLGINPPPPSFLNQSISTYPARNHIAFYPLPVDRLANPGALESSACNQSTSFWSV